MAKLRETMSDTPTDTTGEGKPKSRRTQKRIIVYQNDDGSPDYSALSDDQKRALGIDGSAGPTAAGPAAEPPAEIPPHMVGMILTVLVGIESAIVGPKMGVPAERARQILSPPDHIGQGIVEAGTRVMNKYAGSMGPYADEIMLASLIITWQASAFAEMRRVSETLKPAVQSPPPPPDIHHTVEEKPKPTVIPFPSATGGTESVV